MRSTRSFLLNSIRRRNFTASHSPASNVTANSSKESDHGTKLDSKLFTPLASYLDMVHTGEISEDNHQLGAVKKLQSLYDKILVIDSSILDDVPTSSSNWFSSIFDSSTKKSETSKRVNVDNIKGLYMYGGTGCGKTFIMDMFFEMIPIKKKKRVHFSNFMIDIHKRLHRLKSVTTGSNKSSGDSIMEQITDELMNEAYLLCFDEFQVTDIADAMIIKSLFESLLNKGMIIVATSNRPPIDLYKNGLQRSLFLPFIKMLSESTDVHSLMESSMDYRLVKGAHSAENMYLSPMTKENESNFEKQFRRLSVPICQEYQKQLQDQHLIDPAHSHNEKPTTGISRYPLLAIQMSVFGHLITSTHTVAGRRITKFTFNQLCDENLGAADYIHLSETFRIIFLSHVPILTLDNRNEMRRFITFIDAMYEKSVRIIVLADEIPTRLLQLTEKEKASPHDEVFAFDRTISRLLEMQSEEYLRTATEQYPVESGGAEWLYRELCDTTVESTTGSLSESLWKQYNYGRETNEPLPVSCLQVLLIDLLEVLKLDLKNNNDTNKSHESIMKIGKINVDQSISLIGQHFGKVDGKETHIRYEIFSTLLVFTLPIDSP